MNILEEHQIQRINYFTINKIIMRLKKVSVIIVLISYFGNCQTDNGPYFATGIRIGDVSQNEAIIWTRLTKNKVRINDAPLPISLYVRPENGKRHLRETRRDKDGVVYFPQGFDINTIEGAVPGAEGEVKINYRPKVLRNGISQIGSQF